MIKQIGMDKDFIICNDTEWVYCPICKAKTRLKVRADTVLKCFPLFCPKCKQESLIDIEKFRMTIIQEPDALDAEPMNL